MIATAQKEALLNQGAKLMELFCAANNLLLPPLVVCPREKWQFACCAYYRPTIIKICVDKCASIGFAGRQWSYPGHTVDRTPYGVIQHEVGHHVDVTLGNASRGYSSDFSKDMRAEAGEQPLTGYCPDDGEWFAEMCRLFITNPDLLRLIRPRTFDVLRCYLTPVVTATWEEVLKEAPFRTIDACRRKIAA